MDAGPALLISLVLAGYYLIRRGTAVPSRVLLANPTTTWPIGTVILAGLIAVVAFVILNRAQRSLALILLFTGAAGFVVLRGGRSVAPTRVVYDRGGTSFPPGAMTGALLVVVVVFYVLTSRP